MPSTTVDCDEAISVNAHNPHIAAKYISINRHHCKFGRAKNLRARYRNYLKTFAPHWVTFRVVASLDDINAAEAACGKELISWRVRGRTGRLNEWLLGVGPAEVEKIVVEELERAKFSFARLELQPAKSSSR